MRTRTECLTKRLLTLLLLVGMMLGALFFPTRATDEPLPENEGETEITYYGRAALAELERADVLLYAYDSFVAGVEESSPVIYVSDGVKTITTEEADIAFEAYRRDHTEHFWLGTKYSIHYVTLDDAVYITPSYTFEGEELLAAKAVFESEVLELLEGIDDTMSGFEKELILHDRLAGRVTYDEDTNAHSAYGAIVDGRAVCEGYAEALQYLMQRVGVEGFIATGASTDPSSGTTVGHAWNMFKLDGKYYHTDLTWNDQGETLYHAYFNVTDAQILEDHVIEEVAFALPVADSEDESYFTKLPGRLDGSEYSVSEVAALMRDGGNKAHVYITGSTDGFLSWYTDNISDISKELGVVGKFSYSYSRLGREIAIAVLTCKHNSLSHIAAKDASCTDDGNIAYYLCECGKYFADRFALSEITDKSSVVKAAAGHDFSTATEEDAFIRTEGSCQTAKTYWYACSVCGESAKSDPFAYGKFYTGATFGAHNIENEWSREGGRHFKQCSVSGCDYTENDAACSGGIATCVSLARCDICGGEYGGYAEHELETDTWSYSSDEGHARMCLTDGCGAHGEIIPHTGSELCEACGYERIPDSGEAADGVITEPSELEILLEKALKAVLIAMGILIVLFVILRLFKLLFRKKKK